MALFVWLETPHEGVFSDNGFLMTAQEAQVDFFAGNELTTTELMASITVKSLTDTHQRGYEGQTLPESMMHPNDIRNVWFA